MKSLIHLTLLSSLVFAVGACGNDASSELASWKKASCACKDKACAEKQGKAFWTLVKKFKNDKPAKEEAKKLDKLADEGQECLEKLEVDVYALK